MCNQMNYGNLITLVIFQFCLDERGDCCLLFWVFFFADRLNGQLGS